jgi:CelD/BcsL family acetyltransferase involved in cellulose biosynthesis
LRDVHVAATRLAAADMNLMWLGDQPVAFAYNYVWNGYLYGLRTGFDASVCRSGVGSLLLMNVICDSIRRGYHTYDLGPGYLAGKRHIQTQVKDVLQYTHFHTGTPRAQLLRLRRIVGGLWSRAAGNRGSVKVPARR